MWTHVHVRYMLSPVRLSSVRPLSVTFVRFTQPVEIFGNVSSLVIRWHPRIILRISSQGNPYVGVGGGGTQDIEILDPPKAISRKWCKIRGKLVLITNRKSYMRFRLVPKSVTLNDPERRNGPYFALFHRIRQWMPMPVIRPKIVNKLTASQRRISIL